MSKPEDSEDHALLNKVSATLDSDEQELDPETLRALSSIRHEAVALAEKRGRFASSWIPLTGTALAAGFALVMVMWPTPVDPVEGWQFEDMEILVSNNDIEMLEDLEFYMWLEEIDEQPLPG
ncbi:MAG: hypothetical protein ACR2PS_04590 [Pseudomonadales bacterium]